MLTAKIGAINGDGCKVHYYAYGKLEGTTQYRSYDEAREDAHKRASEVLIIDRWYADGTPRYVRDFGIAK
jgi:hypothetical protein